MRFLIDNALSPTVAIELNRAGHDAVHVRELDMQAASDKEIFDREGAADRMAWLGLIPASTFRSCSRASPAAAITPSRSRRTSSFCTGQCIAIVDGEERAAPVGLLHCPAGTEHAFVRAGDRPCAVLMIGSRREGVCHYSVNDVAARYGTSVSEQTDDPAEAYADWLTEMPDAKIPNNASLIFVAGAEQGSETEPALLFHAYSGHIGFAPASLEDGRGEVGGKLERRWAGGRVVLSAAPARWWRLFGA